MYLYLVRSLQYMLVEGRCFSACVIHCPIFPAVLTSLNTTSSHRSEQLKKSDITIVSAVSTEPSKVNKHDVLYTALKYTTNLRVGLFEKFHKHCNTFMYFNLMHHICPLQMPQ